MEFIIVFSFNGVYFGKSVGVPDYPIFRYTTFRFTQQCHVVCDLQSCAAYMHTSAFDRTHIHHPLFLLLDWNVPFQVTVFHRIKLC